ncbi:MAG: hypothetical protein PHT16_00640 [Candidatus Pacebacteria bacterium]|nr:hypothetical protein [Candidatus Paceibacterota bacterium]
MPRKIKKIIPYFLILLFFVVVGIFSPMVKVHASAADPNEACTKNADGNFNNLPCKTTVINDATNETVTTYFGEDGKIIPGAATVTPPKPVEKSEFENWAKEESCGIIGSSSVAGCTKALFYYIVYTPSSVFLTIAAKFFNALIKIALDSEMISGSTFISTAWGVVRDLSNIFFILILLYIAIKLILGLGGSEVKKMIANVIIMALLINFSMFFTKVIIDTSNILALIFYNKLDVTYKDPNTGQPATRPDTPTTPGEKEISGAMYGSFDVTTKLNNSVFWEDVRGGTDHVPVGTMIGIICIAAGIMLFAAYAFFVSGVAFVARLIELWILIIFSPFAFMSFTVPKLAGTDYIGWDGWFKRLLKVSFMAPIFMFFIYLIFLLLEPPGLFGNITAQAKASQTWVQTLLFTLIPAMVIMVLLLRATKYAKEGSGAIGEMVFKGAKIVGGLALGGAIGGAAFAGRNVIGGGGGYLANKAASGMNKLGGKLENKYGRSFGINKVASGLTSVGTRAQKGSFDLRGIPGASKAIGMAGLTAGVGIGSTLVGSSKIKTGGIAQTRKEKVEKRMKRADMLKVREDEGLKQKLNKSEIDLQTMLNKVAKDFEKIDKGLEGQRQAKNDAAKDSIEEKSAIANIAELKAQKAALVTGALHTGQMLKPDGSVEKTTSVDGSILKVSSGDNVGKTIKQLQTEVIPDQKNAILTESRRRTTAFANRKGSWGPLSSTANKEARYKIIMESKIESKA